MVKRFVVLSLARSGTSLLVSTLRMHPEIMTHGEIFHPNPRWHLFGNLHDLPVEEMRKLQKQPDFLDRVYAQDRSIVGFKMWRPQNPVICDQLMEDMSVAKIIYERENSLAQFSSLELARATGVWNKKTAKEDGKEAPKKVAFNAERFAKFRQRRDNIFKTYRARCKGEVLALTYREIAGGLFSKPLEFLGAPVIDLVPQKSKLHSSNILSRFVESDHDKIRSTLATIGKDNWVDE